MTRGDEEQLTGKEEKVNSLYQDGFRTFSHA